MIVIAFHFIKKVFKYLFIDFRDASSHQLHVVFLLI
ncbi:hypothetical protein [Latilactobacillus phage TMW 1.1365 P3]|nr:hypothetical protein [Latilactobacillus phage TMW 1.1365 P3]